MDDAENERCNRLAVLDMAIRTVGADKTSDPLTVLSCASAYLTFVTPEKPKEKESTDTLTRPVLYVDQKRFGNSKLRPTGIFVRAQNGTGPGAACGTYDIIDLTQASLLDWLHSRGGTNDYACNVVLELLKHLGPERV